MKIINGKEIAQNLIERLKKEPPIKKYFAAFLVGENPASEKFLKQKERVAKELSIDFRLYKMPQEIKNDELRKKIHQIVDRKNCGGAIVELPLPEHLNSSYILNSIPPQKDPDALSERALGSFYNNRSQILPPSVAAVKEILAYVKKPVIAENLKAAIVGLGILVGKPIANWFMGRAEEIYLLDKGSDFSILKNADLVISGVGKAGLIKPEMLKIGAGVIDFGTSFDAAGKVKGDFDASSLADDDLSFYTPTPNGTGPILVAKLFENFYFLNK